MRPLPLVLPETEAFWTGGRDGRLRDEALPGVRRGCGTRRRPCARSCPTGSSSRPTVSGSRHGGRVHGQPQQWLPDPAPPYVVAIVALDEDPRVRLTTNIVDAEPDDVAGRSAGRGAVRAARRRLAARCSRRPATGRPAGGRGRREPEEPPLPRGRRPPDGRPPTSSRTAVAITGIGMSRRRAAADARPARAHGRRVPRRRSTTPGSASPTSTGSPRGRARCRARPASRRAASRPLENALRHPPDVAQRRHGDARGTAARSSPRCSAVAAGLCRHVLVLTARSGSRPHTELMRIGAARAADGRAGRRRLPVAPAVRRGVGGELDRDVRVAVLPPLRRDREMLGWIALNARANAARNPAAIYRDPMTMDDYLDARMITTPFGLYDCDVPCDGAIAIDRLGGRRGGRRAAARRSGSRPSARRSPNPCRGTRAR